MAKKEKKKKGSEPKPKVLAPNSVQHSSPTHESEFGGLPTRDLKKNLGCG